MEFFLIGLAQLATIFAKAFQQQNVTHEKYQWIIPTSYVLAFFEIGVIIWAVKLGHMAWIAVGTGAWIGAICAVKLHRYLRK
jgi:hypothetical protein